MKKMKTLLVVGCLLFASIPSYALRYLCIIEGDGEIITISCKNDGGTCLDDVVIEAPRDN